MRLLLSLIAAGALLAACALVPPVPLGAGALGYVERTLTVPMTSPTALGLSPLAASGTVTTTVEFDDTEPPSMPIGPSSLQTVQGFDEVVTAFGGSMPVTMSLEGTLGLRLEDASDIAPVSTEVPFGPLTLNRPADCSGASASCDYTFDDPVAASTALTATIGGANLSRLLTLITSGGENTLTIELSVETDGDPLSLTVTVVVEENYIRF